jgi:chorismate mutase
MTQSTIDALRTLLENVDKEILTLASKRIQIVQNIYAVKKEAGIDLFDPEREELVIKYAEEVATKVGIDEALAREIIQVLIKASHEIQEI